MQSKLALDCWGAACLSECKGRVIFGWFQIISRFLRRLVATGLGKCDKLRVSPHLRVAWTCRRVSFPQLESGRMTISWL